MTPCTSSHFLAEKTVTPRLGVCPAPKLCQLNHIARRQCVLRQQLQESRNIPWWFDMVCSSHTFTASLWFPLTLCWWCPGVSARCIGRYSWTVFLVYKKSPGFALTVIFFLHCLWDPIISYHGKSPLGLQTFVSFFTDFLDGKSKSLFLGRVEPPRPRHKNGWSEDKGNLPWIDRGHCWKHISIWTLPNMALHHFLLRKQLIWPILVWSSRKSSKIYSCYSATVYGPIIYCMYAFTISAVGAMFVGSGSSGCLTKTSFS